MGRRCRAASAAARGRYVIMGDADDSYDFSALDGFVAKLREGYALVVGNRFRGGIRPGAMPVLNRYLGNPVLSFIGALLFKTPVADFHCGLRGFDRRAILDLGLVMPGMEFASEMVVKAAMRGLRTAEVPIVLHPDGRGRPPHLRPWRDGWRHLKFLLMHSPRWLYLYPGLVMAIGGLGGMILLAALGSIRIFGIELQVHSMLAAGIIGLLGDADPELRRARPRARPAPGIPAALADAGALLAPGLAGARGAGRHAAAHRRADRAGGGDDPLGRHRLRQSGSGRNHAGRGAFPHRHGGRLAARSQRLPGRHIGAAGGDQRTTTARRACPSRPSRGQSRRR